MRASWVYPAFFLITSLASVPLLANDNAIPPIYGQVHFGRLNLDDNSLTYQRGDQIMEGEFPDHLPYLGASAQAVIKDGLFGYGWEAGGFFSWHNNDVDFAAKSDEDGGTIKVNVDNAYWSFETFMGLYASAQPLPRLRFYVGAGPLFLFATSKVDNVDEKPDLPSGSGTTIIIDTDDYHTDFSVGHYARAGVDIYLMEQFWVGFTARRMNVQVDLPKTIGQLDLDGNVYFFTLTRKY